jgi:hypothetical protein
MADEPEETNEMEVPREIQELPIRSKGVKLPGRLLYESSFAISEHNAADST